MTSIYFAGPDVFSPDYPRRVAHIRELCAVAGLTPLLPGDVECDGSLEIYQQNVALIRQADGVIANLDPFRGPSEPDSGTVFECGLAVALGKTVVGIVSDQRDLLTKLRGCGAAFDGPLKAYLYENTLVEDFGHPLNLMLGHSLAAIVDTLENAVAEAARLLNKYMR
ncbi:MAG: nucleoside 2-deoxyribosyltransferase [Candidatus Adiutrix sp.]|jgi:nucleoside 2-deoxyribosyltransferase|nr:nucleoside 2-deoxyribosyltransferase [Candidatus Adiutrix sp.]